MGGRRRPGLSGSRRRALPSPSARCSPKSASLGLGHSPPTLRGHQVEGHTGAKFMLRPQYLSTIPLAPCYQFLSFFF